MDVVGGGFVRIKLGFYMLDSVMEQFYEGGGESMKLERKQLKFLRRFDKAKQRINSRMVQR